MSIFHLPDLGEGLAEAEIHEWHVIEGDMVKLDQPLVTMETAKAVVEVPSPQAGKVIRLFGKKGDIIPTHSPLIEFADQETVTKDRGTVVGSLEESTIVLDAAEMMIGAPVKTTSSFKAMPAVRVLAKQLNVDLNLVVPSGPQGQITAQDVKSFAEEMPIAAKETRADESQFADLHGVRRAMAIAMTSSHQQVVPATITEDADVTDLLAHQDITSSLIQAIIAGLQKEPSLNAWYKGQEMKQRLLKEFNIGLAMDTEEGLFVPVLKDVAKLSLAALRENINQLKQSVKDRRVTPQELQGATFTLSNFGMMAGKYATPIIIPPQVAILGCGQLREGCCVYQGKMAIRKILPLSLTFDHRVVTGGEAARFLGSVVQKLAHQANE